LLEICNQNLSAACTSIKIFALEGFARLCK